jgi:thiol:disulfide interchange protein
MPPDNTPLPTTPPVDKKTHITARLVYASVIIVFVSLCTVAALTTAGIDKAKKGFKPITVKQPISFIDQTYLKADGAKTPTGQAVAQPSKPLVPIAEQLANVGLQQVDAPTLQRLLPPANTPRVLVFHSKFCLDCQAMAPVLADLSTHYPTVHVTRLDVARDKDLHYELFEAFRPTTVPAVVFVAPNGTISHVVGDGLSLSAIKPSLTAGFNTLSPTPQH